MVWLDPKRTGLGSIRFNVVVCLGPAATRDNEVRDPAEGAKVLSSSDLSIKDRSCSTSSGRTTVEDVNARPLR